MAAVTVVVALPEKINDSHADFAELFRSAAEASRAASSVVFDLSGCRFIRAAGLVILGGAAMAAAARGVPISFRWPTDANALDYLGKSSFLEAFGGRPFPYKCNSIPFRNDRSNDKHGVVGYLHNDWLGRGWVKVSSGLAAAIVGKALEIFDNAFCHSGSPVGTVSCGQYFPAQRCLTLTVADFGVGIASKVRGCIDAAMTDEDALRWALKEGNSTRSGACPGGMGLKLLRSFVDANRGKMVIYSNAVSVYFSNKEAVFRSLATPFSGTVFHIELNCDEKNYILASEAPPPPRSIF